METLYQVLGLIAAGVLIWLLYTRIKYDKAAFSREHINKSLYTLGILGLILIVFVMFLVYLVRV